jgi:hypothetical protein
MEKSLGTAKHGLARWGEKLPRPKCLGGCQTLIEGRDFGDDVEWEYRTDERICKSHGEGLAGDGVATLHTHVPHLVASDAVS